MSQGQLWIGYFVILIISSFIDSEFSGVWLAVGWIFPIILFYLFKEQDVPTCPKCDSENLKVVKAGKFKHLLQQNVAIWVPGAKISKPLNVCRDCGFSWEDR